MLKSELLSDIPDIKSLKCALEGQNYIFDEDFLVTVYVALRLGRPLLIEGAAGVGKTEVAKALASALEREMVRLQCYEGMDESKALYEWNYQKQLLSIQTRSVLDSECNADAMTSSLFSEEFLLERPLLYSIRSEKPVVLLIDEIDKADEEFEAFLLELLSDFQVSIPELGTIKARSHPIVILTSNNMRPLSEALKRRCAYLFIPYPSIEKETRIIEARLPNAGARLAADVAAAVYYLRSNPKIYKKPSIAESLDWVSALEALGQERLDSETAMKTAGFILKSEEDLREMRSDEGFVDALNSHDYSELYEE